MKVKNGEFLVQGNRFYISLAANSRIKVFLLDKFVLNSWVRGYWKIIFIEYHKKAIALVICWLYSSTIMFNLVIIMSLFGLELSEPLVDLNSTYSVPVKSGAALYL